MENLNEYSFWEDFKDFLRKRTGKVCLIGGVLVSIGVLTFFATYDYQGEAEALENCKFEPVPTEVGMVSTCNPEQTAGGIISEYLLWGGMALSVSGVGVEIVGAMKGQSSENE